MPPTLTPYGLNTPTLDVHRHQQGRQDRAAAESATTPPTNSGTYAKLAGNPRSTPSAATSRPVSIRPPNDLRDKRLLTFDRQAHARRLAPPKGRPSNSARMAQNEWQILKPRPLRADGAQVDGLISKLKDAKMDVTIPSRTPPRSSPTARQNRAPPPSPTFGGTQTLEVRQDKDKNYFAKSSAVEGIYKISADRRRRARQERSTISAIKSSSISASATPPKST